MRELTEQHHYPAATSPRAAAETTERDRLRLERSRLECQESNLTLLDRFIDPDDEEARELYRDVLRQHARELRAFRDGVEAFQSKYGPLGR